MRDTAVIARNGNGSRGPLPDVGKRADGEPLKLTPVRKLDVGRQTVSSDAASLFSMTGDVKRPLGRDRKALEALKVIRDLDPIASDAVFVLLRMLNPGHNLKAYQFLADGSEVDSSGEDASPQVKSAQLLLDGLARRIGGEYGGGLDQLVNVLGLQVLTHGAVAMEVAPSADLRDIDDWYPIDPLSLHFKRVALTDAAGNTLKNERTGVEQTRLALGQRFASGKFIEVNTEQVFYMPLDPDTDDFYGRPPLMAAVSSAMFLAQMLYDLRAVAHNQGYPRLDVKVVWEIIKTAAPPHLLQKGEEEAFAEWAQLRLDEVVDAYGSLEIDDTFVHFDWVEFATTGGLAGGAGTFDFKAFESVLVRQLAAALKTLPILLGINESTSETHGSVQWQIQVAGVDALRKIVKRIVEKAANVTLQIFGAAAHGKMEYTEIRTVDRLFEANAEFIETKTLVEQVKQGWRDNDEASEIATGHAAKGEPGEFGGKLAELEMAAIEAGIEATASNESQQPSQTEKQAGGTIAPLVLKMLEPETPAQRFARRAEARAVEPGWIDFAGAAERDDDVAVYENLAVVIFKSMEEVLVDLLEAEGIELRQRFTLGSQQAKDVADHVFGIRYSREMKGMLRDAVQTGLEAAGHAEATPSASYVDRVWRENRQYVNRIRDDLKAALRGGEFESIGDVRRWFERNAYREDLMGRYLAKQGIEGGYAQGRSIENPNVRFFWQLGVVLSQHCMSCEERSGVFAGYTWQEIQSIGAPGSGHLNCGANCHCTLVEGPVSTSGPAACYRTPGGVQHRVAGAPDYGGECAPAGDGHDAMVKQYTPWAESLSTTEREALVNYKESAFRVNKQLRTGEPQTVYGPKDTLLSVDERIKLMDSALARSRLPQTVNVSRVMSQRMMEGRSVGDTFTDKAYVSTSINTKEANQFVQLSVDKGSPPAVIRIRVDAGQRGAYMETVNAVKEDYRWQQTNEYEMLLPRDTTFRVIGRGTPMQMGRNICPVWDVEVVDG